MIPEHGHLYVRNALTNFRNPMTANLFLCLHIMAVWRVWMEMGSRRLDHRMECRSGSFTYSHSLHMARYDDGSEILGWDEMYLLLDKRLTFSSHSMKRIRWSPAFDMRDCWSFLQVTAIVHAKIIYQTYKEPSQTRWTRRQRSITPKCVSLCLTSKQRKLKLMIVSTTRNYITTRLPPSLTSRKTFYTPT